MFASLAITNRCNMRCKMCDVGQKNESASGLMRNWNSSKELNPDEWAMIMEALKVSHIHILGVEPLLYDKFDLLLEKIHDGRNIKLTTNGFMMHRYIDAINKYCNSVMVSIDGLKDTHDKIRGVSGSFHRAFEGVLKLKELGKRVGISFAITPYFPKNLWTSYISLTLSGVKVLFNHYNYIHPDCCVDFECKPSNNGYDILDIDVDELYAQINKIGNGKFYPRLDKHQLKKWYGIVPCNFFRKKCMVLEDMASGNRCSIASDGRFIMPERCWFTAKDLGMPSEGIHGLTNSLDLDNIIKYIESKGLPSPCQRLCCAGVCL